MVGTRRTQVARKQINRISKSPHPRTPKRATNQRCVSPVIESRTPQISMSRVSTSRSSSSDGEPEFDLDTVLKSVKQKLVDLKFNVPTLTKHLEPHCENLTTLLTRCADLKESNSILIEGPVGSGKRGLVRNAIARFEQSRKSSKNQNSVKFVTLNGTVISDVKSCLREISRQLLTNKSKHEQLLRDLNDENADSDLDGENMDCDAQESNSMLTVGKSLSFLLSTLQETRNTDGQSLVFILEGFEHFVQSKSQMLLYNLFDTCQSFRTPLVVIAVSNRLDSTELLEKRVKSRFSHRSITLWNDLSFDQWIQCAKDLLKVEPLSKRDSGRNSWNKSVDNLLKNDN
ncbi:origin recognition complex subunit 4-like isoform X1 [Convolutriloba macropyga]|uniref:origin recognition complex subunit 4-like isoform X1 n=1 Tax=Convolutriloba macropyga TaxID=536237 RepID=UPI003F527050